jgi:hypothetical protein
MAKRDTLDKTISPYTLYQGYGQMKDSDLNKGSSYPVLRLGEDIIWDLTDLHDANLDGILFNDQIAEPTKIDENHVGFCKCNFNTRALIYENATTDEVLLAWTTVKEELKLNRLIKLFLTDSMLNLRLTRSLDLEPDLVLILRLIYWYYYCKGLTTSFVHKKKEVRDGLIRGRLTNREAINRQLDVDLTDQQIENMESILLRNTTLQKEADNLRNQWAINTWNVTSELLFAGISGKHGFDITFVPKSQEHDYDFLVCGLPCQVYSFNTPESVKSITSNENLRKASVEQNMITYDLAISMVKESLLDKSNDTDYKLSQGAKIIFVNGTSDESGRFLSQHFFSSDGSSAFDRSLSASLNMSKSDETALPLLYCSTGFRTVYHIFAIPFKVPLSFKGNQRKVDKEKNIEIMKCLFSFNDEA